MADRMDSLTAGWLAGSRVLPLAPKRADWRASGWAEQWAAQKAQHSEHLQVCCLVAPRAAPTAALMAETWACSRVDRLVYYLDAQRADRTGERSAAH